MEQANEKQLFSANPTHSSTMSSEKLQNRVMTVIDSFSLINPNKPIIIGVSGGSDSITLLHLLSILFPETLRVAAYIDHGLRPSETTLEKKLVKNNAIACSAVYHSVSVDVKSLINTQKLSTEEAARMLRYKELENIQNVFQAGCIAVGHTADDQAEEILLRLIRGSGCKGLSGMSFRHGAIIRPLLQETKETLAAYLKQQKIQFCEDSSNSDTRFLRNRIRLDLLPKLEQEYNEGIRKTLLQTASILREDDHLLQRIMEESYQKVVWKQKTEISEAYKPQPLNLAIEPFANEPISIQRRIMEKICIEMNSKPSFQKINLLLTLVNSNKNGEIHLSKGLRAHRQADLISFHYPIGKKAYRGSASPKRTFPPIAINNPGSYLVIELGYELIITEIQSLPACPSTTQLFLDPEKLSFPLFLRPTIPGDQFHPFGAPGRKKISRFLSDRKIPANIRNTYPVLISENSIIALIGLRITHSVRIHSLTKHIWQLDWKKSSSSNSLHQNI